MARVFADVADDELDSGISAGATSSTLTDASEFPATGDFSIRFEDATDPTVFEIVTATARSGNVITHAATASAWDAGDKVYQVVAKVDLDAFLQKSEFTADHDILMGTGAGTFTPIQPAGTAQIADIADTEAAGTSDTWARGDHVHRRASFAGVRAYRSASLSPAHGTETNVGLDAESYDTNAFHDNATNNTRLTVPSGMDGKYRVLAFTSFVENATGQRFMKILKNGVEVGRVMREDPTTSFRAYLQLSWEGSLVAGDYIEMLVYQNSGAGLALTVGENGTYLAMQYLGA